MKRSDPTKRSAQAPSAAKPATNSLQRHGQTVTVMFGRRRPGPSVDMLFEDADRETIDSMESSEKSR